jgi:hypothetical protein
MVSTYSYLKIVVKTFFSGRLKQNISASVTSNFTAVQNRLRIKAGTSNII